MADMGRKKKKTKDLCSGLFLNSCVMWTSCWTSLSHRQGGSVGKDQLCKKNPLAATIAQLLLAQIIELPWASVPFSWAVTARSQSCYKDWTWSALWSISYLQMLLFPSSVMKGGLEWSVLVSCGCHHKAPWPEWLKPTEMHSLTFLETKPEIKVSAGLYLVWWL